MQVGEVSSTSVFTLQALHLPPLLPFLSVSSSPSSPPSPRLPGSLVLLPRLYVTGGLGFAVVGVARGEGSVEQGTLFNFLWDLVSSFSSFPLSCCLRAVVVVVSFSVESPES